MPRIKVTEMLPAIPLMGSDLLHIVQQVNIGATPPAPTGVNHHIELDELKKFLTDQYYVAVAAVTSITVNHNLDKYVHVELYDTSNRRVEADIELTDSNNFTVTWNVPFSGYVLYL